MFNWINEIFKKNKIKKLKNSINKKYHMAVDFQRNGKIKEYSVLMNEISKLEDEYARLQDS